MILFESMLLLSLRLLVYEVDTPDSLVPQVKSLEPWSIGASILAYRRAGRRHEPTDLFMFMKGCYSLLFMENPGPRFWRRSVNFSSTSHLSHIPQYVLQPYLCTIYSQSVSLSIQLNVFFAGATSESSQHRLAEIAHVCVRSGDWAS